MHYFLIAIVTTLSSDSTCCNKRWRHFESFPLFSLDTSETVLGASACFCVGHPEHIVGFHATVDTTVTWNGCPQLKSLWFLLNTIKCSNCFAFWLFSWVLFAWASERLASGVIDLRCLDFEESVDWFWRNWLLQCQYATYFIETRRSSIHTNNFGNCFVTLSCVIYKLLLHYCVVFEVCRFVTPFVEGIGLGSETCHSVGLAENNFRLNALNVTSISCTINQLTHLEFAFAGQVSVCTRPPVQTFSSARYNLESVLASTRTSFV